MDFACNIFLNIIYNLHWQVAKDTNGNNKLFEIYQKYKVCKTVSVCTRPLECEMVSHIAGMLNCIFALALKAKVIGK